tara:strand:- start:87 stop:578 length:492 start_codon:yes stop_codon:yes gene_type:complete
MKNIILLITISLLLTGCFKDKSEEAIKNCADTLWSKQMVKDFKKLLYVDNVYLIDRKPKNIFDENVLLLKQAGFTYKEARDWAKELETTDIDDGNRKVINFLTGEKNKINKSIDDHFKLPLNDRLQNRGYEKISIKCERVRKKASKTFDAKWQKPKIKKVEFR